jgi:hypothetical protein
MAVLIANDWKSIHDRMQQIKSEELARLCQRCRGLGWILNPERPRPQRGGYMFCTCDSCRNPNGLLPPDF